ncbi:nickel ABC transporter permease [Fusibacter ferrireducens]|uniref:Nickel import system permease protein NikB n=1 Tax=Fusibacter ferrireducens TaxID=2785058 RepID=A0ABR9ZUC5_9FIRM|nr:nickel ABC transporter permease [Fusibacter ferrireducens]MBF4693951.1 ABC transporter permease [Fusibacter ferrireducens]
MKRYILNRIIQLIPILVGITLFSFLLMNIGSTDAVDVIESNTGGAMSALEKSQLRAELGLDKSLMEQYVVWLSNVLRGNMGTSFISSKPVMPMFLSKLPATIYLAFTSILLTLMISIPMGIFAAVKQNKFSDYLIRFLCFSGNALPNFFVSLLLIYFFAIKLKLFPVMGNNAGFKSVILPALTLTIAMASKYTRMIRTTVLEELNKDYVQGARARGIHERKILFFSVLKASMLTIVTLVGLSMGSLLGGTAIVESIFMWDGAGKMAIDAIIMRDYPVIQAYVIWMAIIYIMINLFTDIIYHYLDPRIRLGQEHE